MTVTITQKGDITQVGENVRLESGPVRKIAIATEELLHDDATAGHYYVGERIEDGVRKIGRDALGKPIVLGEEMTYLQWGGRNTVPVMGWYVYKTGPAGADRLEFNADNIAALNEKISALEAITGRSQEDDVRLNLLRGDLHRIENIWLEIGVYEDRDTALANAVAAASEE